MALSSMISKAYRSSVVSFTLTAIGSSATLNGTILATRQRRNGSLNVQSHNFCSLTTAKDLVDTSIYKALKNQIKYAKSELKNQVIMPPESFPFKIEEQIEPPRIRLTRKFPDDEVIKVKINTSALDIEEEIESDDDFSSSDDSSEDDNDISDDKKSDGSEKGSNEEDDSESKPETQPVPAIPMTVTIEKPGGRGYKYLVFYITVSTEDIAINSLFISNSEEDLYGMLNLEGPKIKQMDSELQRCLYKYLDIRGIKVNMARFLFKYIAKKKKKDYLLALKHLNKFIKH